MSVKDNRGSTGKGSSANEGESGSRIDALRDRAGDAYDSARTTAIDAYDAARDKAAATGRKAGDGVGEAPLAALAGGLAVGALLAALLPRTKVEDKLIGPVGERLAGAGREAVGAAKDAGKGKLAELDITRDAGKTLVQSLISGIGEAARTSGQAALGAGRDSFRGSKSGGNDSE